ncbi:RNA-directed DNA polymerase-like protein [Cucumis melo var. makuwa]|uniref:RNA-directed DNA polymerase-like protein n=1 Tax=Cucumis melo var. makuwa TaxID=1194695 RepID=A0A5A7TC43_CUCMM|nr:RNA-directed DNA polymerase-like protein [Cucumis melo var. makuwa]TYK23482.1 RNA-directed DNA polymerase-like protein [Cucumis melo var. makuwa]
MIVVRNENNDLIPMRTIMRWRIFMDYRKMNTITKKDHFSLPLFDQMLDMLTGRKFYYFLDGYFDYNQFLGTPLKNVLPVWKKYERNVKRHNSRLTGRSLISWPQRKLCLDTRSPMLDYK